MQKSIVCGMPPKADLGAERSVCLLPAQSVKMCMAQHLSLAGALLHKAPDVRGSPFPGGIHPTVSVTGMPSVV